MNLIQIIFSTFLQTLLLIYFLLLPLVLTQNKRIILSDYCRNWRVWSQWQFWGSSSLLMISRWLKTNLRLSSLNHHLLYLLWQLRVRHFFLLKLPRSWAFIQLLLRPSFRFWLFYINLLCFLLKPQNIHLIIHITIYRFHQLQRHHRRLRIRQQLLNCHL